MDYKKLFHDEAAFRRETLEARVPAKILKGKNPQRVFWAVVTLENMDEIKAAIEEAVG